MRKLEELEAIVKGSAKQDSNTNFRIEHGKFMVLLYVYLRYVVRPVCYSKLCLMCSRKKIYLERK